MKKFNRRKKQRVINGYPASTRVNLSQILGSANVLPLDYELSNDFTRFSEMPYVYKYATKSDSLAVQYGYFGIDPLDWGRSRIRNLAVDEYTLDVLKAEIESKAKSELNHLETQHLNHVYSIKKIIDREKGEREATRAVLDLVESEIEAYDEELAKLSASIK